MNVGFWAASEDGSSWYRCDQPAAALTWRGHTVWSSKVLPPSVCQWSDVVVGSRVVKPGPTALWRQLHDAGRFLVMDFDDDYWHLPESNPAHKAWNQPGVLDQLAENTQLADRVTCASQGLADVLRDLHGDVIVVPNGLHAMYLGAPRRYDDPMIRIGWAGTASTVTELHLAARALNRIVDYRDGRVELVCIGATPEALAQQGLDVQHPRVQSIEWIDDTPTYLRALMGVDVLVAPYRDHPFHAAKFPTKALEAAFLGIPLVASGIRPYREWAGAGRQDAGGGIALVDPARPHEWGQWLRMLVDDPALRAAMGRAGRARAAQNVLQGAVGEAWETALTPPDGFTGKRRNRND